MIQLSDFIKYADFLGLARKKDVGAVTTALIMPAWVQSLLTSPANTSAAAFRSAIGLPFASQAQAETGGAADKAMSPQAATWHFQFRVKAAFVRNILANATLTTEAAFRAAIGAASVADLNAAVAALKAGAPGALDTLDELAAALGDDANFAASMVNNLAGKASLHRLNAIAGSATAFTATKPAGMAALGGQGLMLFAPHLDSGARPTLSLDGEPAVEIRAPDGAELAGGEMPAGTLCPLIYVDGHLQLLTWPSEDLLNYSHFSASGQVGITPTPMASNEPTRRTLEIINPNTDGYIGVAFDADPVLNAAGTVTLGPGAAYEPQRPHTGEVRVVGERANMPVTIYVSNRSGVHPRAGVILDDVAGRMATPPSDAWVTANRTLLSALLKADIFARCPLFMPVAAGAVMADSLLNWADLGTPGVQHGTVTHDPFSFIQGDDVSGYIDTGVIMALDDRYQPTRHFAGLYVHDVVTDNVGWAMGDTNNGNAGLGIGPNRSASNAAFRSGDDSPDTVNVGGRGGLFMLNRTEAAGYTAYRNELAVPVAREVAGGIAQARPVYLCATNAATGAEGFCPSQLGIAMIATALADDQIAVIRSAVPAWVAAMGAL